MIAIVDKNGNTVARYTYDAWGVCTIQSDSSRCDIATINPFRYRGYYYDIEIGLYYVSSRYYNPEIGRWLNSDDANLIGLDGNSLSCNVFIYCYNSLPNYADPMGTSPLQVLLAAVFGVVGYLIGDYIARGCGLSPLGKGAWKYWALRSAVAIGGAALGWFAGGLITKQLVKYLSRNPRIILKLSSKLGPKVLVSILNSLGINPIGLMDKSLLMGFLQTVFNNPKVTMPSAWVKALLPIAEKFGWSIRLDSGHIGTAWNFIHLHIGKVHIAIHKSIISFINAFLKR